MKQSIAVDKYNIAWFKIAEYVARGEKERALGIYRLLSHSIHDRAFARQLEGDILWAFNDSSAAAEKYYQAAQLYQDDQRSFQAVALFEHLILLDSQSIIYLKHLCIMYAKLNLKTKSLMYLERLFSVLEKNKLLSIEGDGILQELKLYYQDDELISFYEKLD